MLLWAKRQILNLTGRYGAVHFVGPQSVLPNFYPVKKEKRAEP
jgi:hypothetical protein